MLRILTEISIKMPSGVYFSNFVLLLVITENNASKIALKGSLAQMS